MKTFLIRRWFLLALAAVLIVGFTCGVPLRRLTEGLSAEQVSLARGLVVFTVMFLMALPLDARSMWTAAKAPRAAMLAVAINLGLLPLLGWVASRGLPPGLDTGLLVTCSIPCTLASAAVWTRRAGGNDAVAILVTMITNLACFLVTPLWLYVLTSKNVQGQWPLDEMIVKLALYIVAPIILAQIMRRVGEGAVGVWAGRRKIPLSVAAQCGVLLMVLIGAVNAQRQLSEHTDNGGLAITDWAVMLATVIGLHLVVLVAGHAIAALLGMPREDRIAVGFAGSQKTITAGLHVAIDFYGGLAILPMVAYHVCQLLVDTLIADRLRRQPPKE